MSSHTVTPLRPRTTFQAQSEILELAGEAIRRSYDRGFDIGEQVGAKRAMAGVAGCVDDAIGLGFLFGVAVGATVTAFVLGWPL